jgi:hypothetical protein
MKLASQGSFELPWEALKANEDRQQGSIEQFRYISLSFDCPEKENVRIVLEIVSDAVVADSREEIRKGRKESSTTQFRGA